MPLSFCWGGRAAWWGLREHPSSRFSPKARLRCTLAAPPSPLYPPSLPPPQNGNHVELAMEWLFANPEAAAAAEGAAVAAQQQQDDEQLAQVGPPAGPGRVCEGRLWVLAGAGGACESRCGLAGAGGAWRGLAGTAGACGGWWALV